jgi:hypothetical protein
MAAYYDFMGSILWRGVTHLAGAGLAGAAIAFPLAAGYRYWCCRRLQRQLSPFSPAARAGVLAPLRHGQHGDTRRVVARLAAGSRAAGFELAGIPAPAGRGDEPTPG